MQRKKTSLAVALLLCVAAASADVPEYINYQGRIGDISDGTVNMKIELFNHATEDPPLAPCLYSEEHTAGCGNAVTVHNGVFSLQIGAGLDAQCQPHAAGALSTALANDAVWAQLSVDEGSGYQIMSPRTRLLMAPYAAIAASAHTATSADTATLAATATSAEQLVTPTTASAVVTTAENPATNGRVRIGQPGTPERLLHVAGDAILIERASDAPAVILRNTANGEINAMFGLTATGPDEGYVYLTDESYTNSAARRIAELQAQTAGPDSPSTPSGMRPVYTKPNITPPRGGRRKRPGARDGHPGHHRPTPTRIDEHKEHRLPVCPCCGGEVQRCRRSRTRLIEDLPEDLQAQVTEHTIHRDYCPKCKEHVEPVVPDALPNATFGHRLISFTSWCHYGLGVTIDQLIDILQFHLQLRLSAGGLIAAWQRLWMTPTPDGCSIACGGPATTCSRSWTIRRSPSRTTSPSE